jgi:putative transposase
VKLVAEIAPGIGTAAACRALDVSRAPVYRRAASATLAPPKPAHSARALSPIERQQVLTTLSSPEHADLAVREVYASCLDQGRYLCSISTMYRILASNGTVRERRDQLRHPSYQKPELLATRPNQVWSWDITKLRGPVKWSYFYLYVLLDIFSRYVVGWMVATREAAALAKRLVREACEREGIEENQLTLHADRGAAMISKSLALLLADLGIRQSHSRPQVSDDNPYSEAQFKTLKYQPTFPDAFGSVQDCRAFCGPFFDWYNKQHHHSGIALLTPEDVHRGRVAEVLDGRDHVLAAAYAAHPERFVRRCPSAQRPPEAAWINPPKPIDLAHKGLPDPTDARSSILGHPGLPLLGQYSKNCASESSAALATARPTTRRVRTSHASDNQQLPVVAAH